MRFEKINLDEADWIEMAPVVWHPRSGDEKLAALVGYMTGDGAIALRSRKYTKKCGAVSVYRPTMVGAFYSNVKEDLESIHADCMDIGMATGASVCVKKTRSHLEDGFQLQINKTDCEMFAFSGVPVGRKVAQAFSVPDWIMNGETGVKRAYIAALFGAEGATPTKDKRSKSRFPKLPVLNMCKDGNNDASDYFAQLRQLLADLGVSSNVTVTGSDYKTYWLRVSSGAENLIRFFEDVGYVYCRNKAVKAWLWAKYLRAYVTESNYRRKTAIELKEAGESYATIGKSLGITRGAAHRLVSDIKSGRATTAGHAFPHFDEWLSKRWIAEKGLLKVFVAGRSYRDTPTTVWNMLVSSSDHSYLLANGANNFNSFETMSGRVYYPFDRNTHVGNYPFNPNLPIWVGMDFNIDPMSAVIFQPQPNGELWAVDEVVRFGSNTEEMCQALDKKFWRHQRQVVIYPDPAGGQRQHARGETDLDILRENGFTRIKYRRKHPLVADRVNAVNRLLRAADGSVRLKIDSSCKHLINAFEQTIYKAGSRDVDKDAGVEHSADAAGYCIELEYPVRKVDIGGWSR